MTNRDFLNLLTTRQLAEFFAYGILVRYKDSNLPEFLLSVSYLRGTSTITVEAFEKWLSDECRLELV